jgi:DNA-binding NarL/FixJ family response regulator
VREAEGLNTVAEGLGNKEIAAQLGISARTVKCHVASIVTKLNAGSRTEAVAMGVRAADHVLIERRTGGMAVGSGLTRRR